MGKKRLICGAQNDYNIVLLAEEGDYYVLREDGSKYKETDFDVFNAILKSTQLSDFIYDNISWEYTVSKAIFDFAQRYAYNNYGNDELNNECYLDSFLYFNGITKEDKENGEYAYEKQNANMDYFYELYNLDTDYGCFEELQKCLKKEFIYDVIYSGLSCVNNKSTTEKFVVPFNGNRYHVYRIEDFDLYMSDIAPVFIKKYYDNIAQTFDEVYGMRVSDAVRKESKQWKMNNNRRGTRTSSYRTNTNRKRTSSSISDMNHKLESLIDSYTNLDDSPSIIEAITPTMYETLSELIQQMQDHIDELESTQDASDLTTKLKQIQTQFSDASNATSQIVTEIGKKTATRSRKRIRK